MNTYKKIDFGNTTYLVDEALPFDKDAKFYESFFDRNEILKAKYHETRGGRGATILYCKDNLNLVLRGYKRGGFVGKFLSDKFFKFESHCHRSIDEFCLLSQMISLDLPVPKPIIAKQTSYCSYYRHEIVILRKDNYQDLSYIIKDRELTDEELIAIGKCISKFFKAGVLHTDLNIRNILINDKNEVCLIDFDKCFIKPNLSKEQEQQMLSRLLRSFKKEVLKRNAHFNEICFEKIISECLKN